MDIATQKMSAYVKEKGINIANMSKALKIPYVSLYDSLANDKRDRNLRAGEFLAICNFLSLNPLDFSAERTD